MDTYEKRNLLEKSYQSAVHEAWKQFIANKPVSYTHLTLPTIA